MIISIIGPSGSGKGTQAELLAKELKLPAVSLGQILRDEAKKGSPDGKIIASYIDKGNLVPSEILYKVVTKAFSDSKLKRGFILDGFPRSQADLDFIKAHLELSFERVFHLDTTDETSIKRMMHRVEEDLKRGKKIRADDNLKGIKSRLAFYHKNIDPILSEMTKSGLLVRINNERPIEEVHQDILSFVKNY